MLEQTPVSLYVHIPWCVRKCPYCDFNSHEGPAALPQAEYVHALLEDLSRDLERFAPERIHSIFFGGGTPSLFSAESIGRLLDGVDQRCPIDSAAEITLEANPGTAEAARFKSFRQAGVNRLSIGVQSFDDHCLKGLGRIHDAETARGAIAMARDAGFDNINIDLMHGLSEQTRDMAVADLAQALEFGPEHLSWYQLTIEPNTVFHARPPTLPLESELERIQQAGETLLTGAGFERYEVSAFAQAGKESLHNLNYWLFSDYLGIGAGAHGKLTGADGRIHRTRKRKQPDAYLAAESKLAEQTEVAEQERPIEFLMNALRLRRGFRVRDYEARTGLPFAPLAKKVHSLQQRGLLQTDAVSNAGADAGDQRICATELGFRYLNSLLGEFL